MLLRKAIYMYWLSNPGRKVVKRGVCGHHLKEVIDRGYTVAPIKGAAAVNNTKKLPPAVVAPTRD
jgi:hypothetical protein